MKMENRESVISLRNVSKTFIIRDKSNNTIREKIFNAFTPGGKRQIHALNHINLNVKKGEFVGIIGRNGSGKSTLIHVITGAYPANRGGDLSVKGTFVRLSLGLGFNPQLTARQNVMLNGSLLGMPISEIKKHFDEIIEFAELGDFVNTQIKYYSEGMKSRLAFSIALHAKADIFLFDEYFGAVGDQYFRKKAFEVFEKNFITKRTIILASHNMNILEKFADRVILLEQGRIVKEGKPKEVIEYYKNQK